MSILDLFRLDGKIALVTGANRGLGRAMAEALAEAGACIVGLSRGDDPGPTAEHVASAGGQYLHIAQDLGTASAADLAATIARVVEHFGRLDILVNNAGIIRRAPAIDYAEADWDAVIQVNLKAAFILAQHAARHMKAQGGGKIVNVASLLSYQGGILVPAYTAAKHGLLGLTRALSNELAPHHINVNALVPGYIETDNTAALRADENRSAAILARIPAGRWGVPDDLRGAAVFLASAASNYMHGASLEIDGGWLAR